jgi:dihydroorotate dehydrogenase
VPDWSYQTLFRPLLFQLPAEQARELTLQAMGTLERTPGGSFLIETMGHMDPPEMLARTCWGLTFPSPVGLGAGLDIRAQALPALAKFGFGYLEVGPVSWEPIKSSAGADRLNAQQAVTYREPLLNDGIGPLLNRLEQAGPLGIPVGARLAFRPGATPREAAEERIRLAQALAPYCQFFTLDTRGDSLNWNQDDWQEHVQMLAAAIAQPILLTVAPDRSDESVELLLEPAIASGIKGVVVAGGVTCPDRQTLVGRPTWERSVRLVHFIRERWGKSLVVIGSGGIHEPADALQMFAAGADFVQLHSGLVYAGPGLPKRINEAIVQTTSAFRSAESLQESAEKKRLPNWLWAAFLGIGMIVGGALAWLVAVTAVVLPYDEAFLGMSRAEIARLNDRLLPFMSHDRISLAGTMMSIGVIYWQLAVCGLRRGVHWTRQTLLVSGAVGFGSFFLFVGYGYFDVLHAVLSLLLLPMFLLGLRQKASAPFSPLPPQLHNDRRWMGALWGQLLFVIIGIGLVAAGLVISVIGVTRVFVPEDLVFLCATPETLHAINDRLIPLIAHDRAGFGGALVSDGLAVLLISLWGFRQGERWVWWTLLLAGVPGFASGIGIHYAVGYTDFWHLAPAYIAALMFLVGLVLSYPYLCATKQAGA